MRRQGNKIMKSGKTRKAHQGQTTTRAKQSERFDDMSDLKRKIISLMGRRPAELDSHRII